MGRDIFSIVLAWLLYLALLRTLQAAGFPAGFDVWPMGEDRNWYGWMQKASGSGIAQLFWQMNDRNPVSPWWYVVAKPVIIGWDNGILIVRYAMSLLCGVASYLCVRGVGGYGSRGFALAVGIFAALFTANGYIDSIYWPFVGALSVSLLSVWAYTRFLDSHRTGIGWWSLSLVLWLFALASYTLQTGAVMAIAYLAYASPLDGNRALFSSPAKRLLRGVGDALPYLALFLIFLLIWRTTASPSMAAYYQMDFSLKQMVTSLALAVWHVDFPNFYIWATSIMSLTAGRVAFLVIGAVVYLIVSQSLKPGQDNEAEVINGRSAFDILVVSVCLVAPTIVVEASSSVWGPGTRWRMVHQYWLPLYLAAVLAVAYVLAALIIRNPLYRTRAWAALVALGAAIIVPVNLGHNRVQTVITASEKALYRGLSQIATQAQQAGSTVTNFIVKMEPGTPWFSADAMSSTYAATWFPGKNTTFRIIQSQPAPDPAWEPWWSVTFGPDDKGIENARVAGGTAPYATTRVVSFDGTTVRVMDGATAEDFKGLRVNWHREGPLPAAR